MKTINERNLEMFASNFAVNGTVNQLSIWFYDWKINFILLLKDKNHVCIMRRKVMDEVPIAKIYFHSILNWNFIQFSFQNGHHINFLAVKEALHRMMLQRQIKASDIPRCNNHWFGREETSSTRITDFWSLPLWTSNCLSSIRVGF